MIVVIEFHWTPEDNNYVKYLGIRDTIEEATGLIEPRFNDEWFNEEYDESHHDYDIMIGDNEGFRYEYTLNKTERWMGDAVGYVMFDNSWNKWHWILFDGENETTVLV